MIAKSHKTSFARDTKNEVWRYNMESIEYEVLEFKGYFHMRRLVQSYQ